ncbi:armadillo-type protein [Crepidotus variabilis]|uniref:Armadillo-type protein n=1 Tax=Crepidotus variabilis TaxID=179855 RepID=A0A9P6E933_9AGAR|nr:armadillo-type protein [Crepidotus variabilis]
MEDLDAAPQPKRFRHQSYNATLKEVHLPSNFQQSHLDHEVADNDSHFHEALSHWKQLNLAPSFLEFARKTDGLSASMPLLLHNWRQIYDLWSDAFKSADDEGLRPLLDLLQNFIHDLRTTISPVYTTLLQQLLSLLPRSISAAPLTTLLETFSSLFRHLLIPAINPDLLDETWTMLCSVLPRCLGEIQRAVAEVWGAVLRRFKNGHREKAVLLLAKSVGEAEDATAWVVVFACKSVSQTLHTCAPSIFVPLLNYHLSSVNPKPTHTLIRRALTALLHHVRTADQFSTLSEPILQKLSLLLKDPNTKHEELGRMLDVASVIISVRQGSRLTEVQRVSLFSELPGIKLPLELHRPLLLFITSLYLAGEMPLWIGPGLKFLQNSWNQHPSAMEPFTQTSLSFTLKLHLCLADANWGGWKMIALPIVLRSTIRPETGLTDRYQQELISFLAALKREKKLGASGEADVVWKKKIESVVLGRLKFSVLATGSSEEMVEELEDLLSLSSYCSGALTMPVIDFISSTIANSEGARASRMLGLCMQAVAKRDLSEWSDKINLGLWTRRCVEKWHSAPEVLEGLVALANANPSTRQIPVAQIYPSLHPSLISHSRSLRLAALRLLDCKLIDPQHDQVEVLKRCLQGEEVTLDVQGVRERVLRIGRVGQVVGDDKGADLCARWLIAQLKVNLRPLWSPAASALASLGHRFGDLVWKLLFDEVKKVTLGEYEASSRPGTPRTAPLSPSQGSSEGNDSEDLDPWEEERSWRDPSAHSVRSVVLAWSDLEIGQRFKDQPIQQERFDLHSYELQLLATLGECCSLVEKHNRELIPHFLSISEVDSDSVLPSKLTKNKLLLWLTLFSKFSNPKAIHGTDALKSLYYALLSHPDRTLQTIALSCIFTYNLAPLQPYEDRIKTLLDDTRWRDELSLLDMDEIPAQSRSEVLDVIIRVLFGVMLEKRGHRGGGGNNRRAAVLSALGGCSDIELGLLVDLMLQPLGWGRASGQLQDGNFQVQLIKIDQGGIAMKQLVGFLTLLEDVLRQLGSKLVPFWPALLGKTVAITATAQSHIDGNSDDNSRAQAVEEEEGEEIPEDEESGLTEQKGVSKVIRNIRQLGLRRFADFFRVPVVFDFTPYIGPAYASFITPRLAAFEKENIQAPSALMELLYVWTVDGVHLPFLVDFNNQTLPKVYDCLVAPTIKPSVVSKIFDIVENILRSSIDDEYISERVLKPHVMNLLSNLAILVEREKGTQALTTPIGQRQISILADVAPYLTNADQASTLLALFHPLLRKSSKIVPEKVKVGLVKIIGDLLGLIPDLSDRHSAIYQKTYGLLSQLFRSLRSRPARLSLVATFCRLSEIDPKLTTTATLLDSLNAYSTKRLDEPDFDRRFAAFSQLNESLHHSLLLSDWLPILHCVQYFIQDAEELAIRNNASLSMRRFIDITTAQVTSMGDQLFQTVLYPGLKNGLRTKNELVRSEVLGVLSYAVQKCDHITSLHEMRTLLEHDDEEANFFNNVLHVQVHRRSRALRRLADHCDEGHLRSSTISDIFLPLVTNFVSSTRNTDHHLVTEAISTTGRMARRLSWGPYYALVQRYLKLAAAKDEAERVYVRCLVALLSNFHFAMDSTAIAAENNDDVVEEDDDVTTPVLTNTPKNVGRILDAVNLRLLPQLLGYLEKNDPNTEDHTRIPIAVGVVAVAQHLPSGSREPQITRLITVLSQILRSRSQETRDLVRDALNRVAVDLGPEYLPIICRELRTALLRGPQLHVLAYVVHSLILHVTTGDHASSFPTLDGCANDVAHVSAEVIFGESGKDVQHEDFKTKMREVRAASSKGLDSFAIVAKFITPCKMSGILAPIRAIMQETSSVKVMGLVDEVLKRVTVGLNGNIHLIPTELLTLCHTFISQNAKFLQQTQSRRKKIIKQEAIVQMKRHPAMDVDHYTNNSYRFVVFGLDLLHSALKRNRLDFRDGPVMSRLESLVVVVGNTLYSTNASVLLLGLRCAADLSKCPLKSMEKSLPVFVQQTLDIIKQTGNTESELVQIAFKSLATILRDGPPVQVKEKDLVYLLELLTPDLEEPNRQNSVFTLLRAIVARKFVVPEIYDLMEKVSEVSVTSQSPQVQELCRGVLLQFLLDYPQGKGRLRNQMTFFAKNLSYVHQSGRTSIMELLGAIITKFQPILIQEYADMLFVALVMVIANDESTKCREMASQLIKHLWTRLDEEKCIALLSHLHRWSTQAAQPLLGWVASQVYGFIVDVAQQDLLPHIPKILEDLKATLEQSTSSFAADKEPDEFAMDVELVWQLPYHSMTTLSKILRIFPIFSLQRNTGRSSTYGST